MSGWGRWGPEGPPPEAYSRVTNPERFRPLHSAMLGIISRLESDFGVDRTEGYGLDEELERRLDLAGPSVRLSPTKPDAAPITVVLSTFPSLHLRFGRWYKEPFPDCGCDACDESAEGEIERLNDMIDDVTAGRFHEAVQCPIVSSPWGLVGEKRSSGRLTAGDPQGGLVLTVSERVRCPAVVVA